MTMAIAERVNRRVLGFLDLWDKGTLLLFLFGGACAVVSAVLHFNYLRPVVGNPFEAAVLSVISKKLADLQTAIAEQTDRVISELEERHRKLATITISSIRSREEARLDQVWDSFYSTTQKLVNNFTSIVHEDVKSQ